MATPTARTRFRVGRRCRWLLLPALALLTYLGGLGGEFVFDDLLLIRDDPFYQDEANPLNSWRRSFWMESRRQGLYRPLTVVSYWLNARLHGLWSPGFRMANLLLHAVVSALVYALARRLGAGLSGALLAGMIFAVHPVHSEAVIPAFGRAELLCALFVLAALLLHPRPDGATMPAGSPGTRATRWWRIGAAAGCLVLACWSKEHAAAFLPLCVLMDFRGHLARWQWPAWPTLRERLAPYAVYVGGLALVAVSRFWALGTWLPGKDRLVAELDNRLALVGTGLRAVSALRIQGMALGKYFWPRTLSHDYSYAQLLPAESWLDAGAALTLLAMVAVPLACWHMLDKRWRPLVLFLPLAWLATILPASNFLLVTGTIFAERLHYLPTVWFCLAVGLVVARLPHALPGIPRGWLNAGLATVLVGACLARTWVRAADWHDQKTLAMAGIRTAPRSAKTWNDLAVALETEGDFAAAVLACNEALRIYPRYALALANRGACQARLGNIAAAEADLHAALQLNPRLPSARYNLGALYANRSQPERAAEIWEGLLRDEPGHALARTALEQLRRDHEHRPSGMPE